ncbi:hypothetical protein [Aliagarivorans taiwanensis]|uniref:hypothetical protein n=1 Tax=Aliagarivorans taiwanensis TaxID=561966 RepID=UPI0012FBF4ED|nr:hypothetical protein [Aliagarivorans taiwanensis]
MSRFLSKDTDESMYLCKLACRKDRPHYILLRTKDLDANQRFARIPVVAEFLYEHSKLRTVVKSPLFNDQPALLNQTTDHIVKDTTCVAH